MKELEVAIGGLDDNLGPLPSNLLDPPMWSHNEHESGSCGPWQKAIHSHAQRVLVRGHMCSPLLARHTNKLLLAMKKDKLWEKRSGHGVIMATTFLSHPYTT